ncbi:MAG: RluA family pseudouridine synthase [Lachnospiraceae bacterium]
MKRVIEYKVEKGFDNATVGQFLKRRLYTSKAIIALKKTPEGILVNREWSYVNRKLVSGDILTIQIMEDAVSEKIVPVNMEIEIVYEDEDILVVNKDADTPIHPSQNNYENSLANGLAYYFEKQGKAFVFRCINRLDRDTTGLTIIAKHQLAGGILSDMVSRREIKRTYLAVCSDDGTLPLRGTIDAPIGRKEGSTIERIIDLEHGESAITHFEKLKHDALKQLSLIKLNLETGRTHQIRVHMKHLGYALIGDDLYQSDMTYISRQALHSYSLTFTHPITLRQMHFVCDLPKDMQIV